MHSKGTQRLVIKIETLKVVFNLVTRSNNGIQDHTTASQFKSKHVLIAKKVPYFVGYSSCQSSVPNALVFRRTVQRY
jgi:hypothetical protein